MEYIFAVQNFLHHPYQQSYSLSQCLLSFAVYMRKRPVIGILPMNLFENARAAGRQIGRIAVKEAHLVDSARPSLTRLTCGQTGLLLEETAMYPDGWI
jgi:hypothetical protein